MKDVGDFESHILEVKCFFSYQGHDLGTEKNGVMVIALTEDLDSIRDSILEHFQHLSTRPCHVTLRLLWLSGPTPPTFGSPSYGKGGSCRTPKCRTFKPLNIGLWLAHWKDVERENGLTSSKNRIIAELEDSVQNEGEEAGRLVAGGDDRKMRKEHGKKQNDTGRAESRAGFPSKSDVVSPISGYSDREGLLPKRRAKPHTQGGVHDNAAERRQSRKQRNAAVAHGEGDVVGAHARELGPGNKGRGMLEKMGWKQGTGLGARGQGVVQPLAEVIRSGKAGLGASRGCNSARHGHECELPPSDDTKVNEAIRRTEARMREDMGNESGSDDSPPDRSGKLPKAAKEDSEREELEFLGTIPLSQCEIAQ